MHIKVSLLIYSVAIIYFPLLASAGEGQSLYRALILENEIGDSREGTLYSWELDGWIGGDYHKLWLKSEGKKLEHAPAKQAELWVMYSRNIATFWDLQLGGRFDEQPESTGYLILGFNGTAPYFLETEAHMFVSDKGDVSARIKQAKEFLFTQRLIAEPYIELNVSLQDVSEQEIGAGIVDGEFGVQTRYEFTRKFAPYLDIHYERKFGETSVITKNDGENWDDFIASVGLRLMF